MGNIIEIDGKRMVVYSEEEHEALAKVLTTLVKMVSVKVEKEKGEVRESEIEDELVRHKTREMFRSEVKDNKGKMDEKKEELREAIVERLSKILMDTEEKRTESRTMLSLLEQSGFDLIEIKDQITKIEHAHRKN